MKGAACHPLQTVLGLAVWLAWFAAVYGGLSLGCAVAPPPAAAGAWNWLNGLLALISITVAVLLLGLAWRCWRAARPETPAGQRFVARLAAGGHLTAALGTLFVAWPLARLPPCL